MHEFESWVQIPSGTRIFFRVDVSTLKNFYFENVPYNTHMKESSAQNYSPGILMFTSLSCSTGSHVRSRPPYCVFYRRYRRCSGAHGSSATRGTSHSGGVETFTDPGECGNGTDRPQKHQDHLPCLPGSRGLFHRNRSLY